MSMYMPNSPRGHMIDYLNGDAATVKARGQQLSTLAADMTNSADVLRRLNTQGAVMSGEAIDKLRETSAEMYEELGRAAALYEVVAPHITSYAGTLETCQTAIKPIVDDLQTLWQTYQQREQEASAYDYATPTYPGGDDADDPVLRQQAEDKLADAKGTAAAAATNARGDWDDRAAEYDAQWDTWYTAFSTAATGIREDVSTNIDDTKSDNIRGFLETAANVLSVAGIVLGVLALIIGGPIIAALAAVVAVAALIVTIAQMHYGDADGKDLAFAIIGVIPFGALGRFSGAAGEGMSFADDFARLTGKGASVREWRRGINAFHGMSAFDSAGEVAAQLFSGRSIDDWGRMGPSVGIAVADTMSTVWGAQVNLVLDAKGWATGDNFKAIGDVFDGNHRVFS